MDWVWHKQLQTYQWDCYGRSLKQVKSPAPWPGYQSGSWRCVASNYSHRGWLHQGKQIQVHSWYGDDAQDVKSQIYNKPSITSRDSGYWVVKNFRRACNRIWGRIWSYLSNPRSPKIWTRVERRTCRLQKAHASTTSFRRKKRVWTCSTNWGSSHWDCKERYGFGITTIQIRWNDDLWLFPRHYENCDWIHHSSHARRYGIAQRRKTSSHKGWKRRAIPKADSQDG